MDDLDGYIQRDFKRRQQKRQERMEEMDALFFQTIESLENLQHDLKEAAVMIENAFPDWFPPEDDREEDVNHDKI